jgi:hypothetical protein
MVGLRGLALLACLGVVRPTHAQEGRAEALIMATTFGAYEGVALRIGVRRRGQE